MTVTAPAPPRDEDDWPVVWLAWSQVELWLTGRLRRVKAADGHSVRLAKYWSPGEHVALIGPTGEGKTTVAVALMKLRKYVLALDPKGEDTTLQSSGYTRIHGVPPKRRLPRKLQRDLDEGRPVRMIVGGKARSEAEDLQLRELMKRAVRYSRHSGGWTLYVDEFELLSSQRMFNQGPAIEAALNTARSSGSSIITAFQAPAWVSKHATRQATFVVLFSTRDVSMIKATAESMGRPWRAMEAAVRKLPPYHVLIIPKDHRAPMVITMAPKT